jgi:hypothetical protein
MVDAGVTPEQVADHDRAVAAQARGAAKRDPVPTPPAPIVTLPLPVPVEDEPDPEPEAAEVEDVEAEKPKRGRKPAPHGTDASWKRGCRGEDCPVSPSCSEVHEATLAGARKSTRVEEWSAEQESKPEAEKPAGDVVVVVGPDPAIAPLKAELVKKAEELDVAYATIARQSAELAEARDALKVEKDRVVSAALELDVAKSQPLTRTGVRFEALGLEILPTAAGGVAIECGRSEPVRLGLSFVGGQLADVVVSMGADSASSEEK